MPTSEVKSDFRRAKILAWWDRYDSLFLVPFLILCGMVVGGYAMSFYDRAERLELMRRHDDDVRDLRMTCRRVNDERDKRVQEATDAATSAAQAVARMAESAADDVAGPAPAKPSVVVKPPPVKRAPPVNLEEAVNRANAQIQQGKK